MHHEFKHWMEFAGLITMLALTALGGYTSFVRLTTDMDDVPLGPLDDENRPKDDPNWPTSALATLSNTAIKRAASEAVGWSFADEEPDFWFPEPFALI